MTKGSITQSPPSVEIDGVLHRQCGEGRRMRRAGSIECGRILPLSAFPASNSYSDGHALVCQECKDKQEARYHKRLAGAVVPVKTDERVPIGSGGRCKGVWLNENGNQVPYLVVIEACRYWKLDGQAQIDRIQAEPTLSDGLTVVKLTTEAGVRPAYALRYDIVPLWLAGVETGRMKDKERRAQLAAYQKTCGQVLADYFFGTQTAPPPPAQRVKDEGTLAGYDDMGIVTYLDAALSSAIAPIYERLGILDALPRIDANAQRTLAAVLGARRIEIEVPAPVINGDVYFGTLNSRLMIPALQCGEAGDWEFVPDLIHMLQTDWVCFIFGESSEMEKRMKRHAGKNRIGKTTPVRPSITSDNPKHLETLFRERKPSGVIAVPNTKDLLVVRKSILSLLAELPNHMPISDAKEHLRTGWWWEK